MEKQHLKRLGYGFSALVMALSAVTFYPANNTYATAVSDATDIATAQETSEIVLAGNINLNNTISVASGKTLTVDVSSFRLTGSNDKPVFTVENGATLKITASGNGAIVAGSGRAVILNNGGTVHIDGGTFEGNYIVYSNSNNAKNEITGGDFTRCKNIFGDYGSTHSTNSISAGTYATKPTALADGFSAYSVEGGVYLVANKNQFSKYNDDNFFQPGTAGNLYSFDKDTLLVKQNIPGTDIDNVVTLKSEINENLTFNVADGTVTVSESASAGDVYDITFIDMSGVEVARKVRVYSAEVSDLEGRVNNAVDLSGAVKITTGDASPVISYATEDEAAKIDGGKLTATASGEYKVKYTITDVVGTEGEFTVTIYPADSTVNGIWQNLEDNDEYAWTGDAKYEPIVSEGYEDIISVSKGEDDQTKIKLLTPYFGEVSYMLGKSVHKLGLRTYSVPKEVAVAVGEKLDISKIGTFPNNGALLRDDLKVTTFYGTTTTKVNIENGAFKESYYYYAEKAGQDTIQWFPTWKSDVSTTIVVYDEDKLDKEVEDKYVSLADGGKVDDIADGYARLSENSELRYAIDGGESIVIADDKSVEFNTPGEKKVVLTESINGAVVNSVSYSVFVTGLKVENVSMTAGEDVTVEPVHEGTIVEVSSNDEKLSAVLDGDAIKLSAQEAGAYDFKVTMREIIGKNGTSVTTDEKNYVYLVTVTEKETPEPEPTPEPIEVEAKTTGDAASTIADFLNEILSSEDVKAALKSGNSEAGAQLLREALAANKALVIDGYDAVAGAVLGGKTIDTELEIKSMTVDEVENADAASEIFKMATDYGYEDLAFYDVNMNLLVDGEKVGRLTDLNEDATVTLAVAFDEVADDYDRHYVVFYYHDGNVYMIDSDEIVDNEDGTISFASHQFSTYAVSYYDTLRATSVVTPDTGFVTGEAGSTVSNDLATVIVAIAAITLAGAAVVSRKRA